MSPEQELDLLLERAGLRLEPDEHERLARLYPTIRQSLDELRLPETRYAEPAATYRPLSA
jgi:hypothetical protein